MDAIDLRGELLAKPLQILFALLKFASPGRKDPLVPFVRTLLGPQDPCPLFQDEAFQAILPILRDAMRSPPGLGLPSRQPTARRGTEILVLALEAGLTRCHRPAHPVWNGWYVAYARTERRHLLNDRALHCKIRADYVTNELPDRIHIAAFDFVPRFGPQPRR